MKLLSLLLVLFIFTPTLYAQGSQVTCIVIKNLANKPSHEIARQEFPIPKFTSSYNTLIEIAGENLNLELFCPHPYDFVRIHLNYAGFSAETYANTTIRDSYYGNRLTFFFADSAKNSYAVECSVN